MKSAYAPHSEAPPVPPDLTEPIEFLKSQGDLILEEFVAALGDHSMIGKTGGMLARLNSYRRAEAILRGLFTVDGEELVDTDSADLPKILREVDT